MKHWTQTCDTSPYQGHSGLSQEGLTWVERNLGLYPVVDCSVSGVDQSVSATVVSVVKNWCKNGLTIGDAFAQAAVYCAATFQV
jgi:hypothetical protein